MLLIAALLGFLPPNLEIPSSIVASIAALMALMVSLSFFGMRTETEYFSASPLTDTGSQPWKYESLVFTPVITF